MKINPNIIGKLNLLLQKNLNKEEKIQLEQTLTTSREQIWHSYKNVIDFGKQAKKETKKMEPYAKLQTRNLHHALLHIKKEKVILEKKIKLIFPIFVDFIFSQYYRGKRDNQDY